MSEPGNMDEDQLSTHHRSPLLRRGELEQHVARVLDERAGQVRFSSELRDQIIQKLPARRRVHTSRRRLVAAFSLACALVLIAGLIIATARLLQPTPGASMPTLTFSNEKVLPTPTQLARGGQSLSLDPTGQHLVYGIATQAGVMYTTNLTAPVANNRLAMEDARDVSWAPDGSALVTTIYPSISTGPLLALVPGGQYMHLLNKQALAASWLPTSRDIITYITQTQGQATLWQIAPDGQNARVLATFPLALLTQHVSWSPDGRYLAILTAANAAPSAANIQGASRALFLFDIRNGSLSERVAPGDFTLASLAWSPNGRILSYEKLASQGTNTLSSFDPTARKTLFTIPLHQPLAGLNWSPDSRALVYSDGGTLHTYTLGGSTIVFSRLNGQAEYPFWLDSQHLLYLALANGNQQLTQLAALPAL